MFDRAYEPRNRYSWTRGGWVAPGSDDVDSFSSSDHDGLSPASAGEAPSQANRAQARARLAASLGRAARNRAGVALAAAVERRAENELVTILTQFHNELVGIGQRDPAEHVVRMGLELYPDNELLLSLVGLSTFDAEDPEGGRERAWVHLCGGG